MPLLDLYSVRKVSCQVWWHRPLIQHSDLCEFEGSPVSTASSRTSRATQGDIVSKQNKTNKTDNNKQHTHLHQQTHRTNNNNASPKSGLRECKRS